MDQLDERLNVTKGERESLGPAGVTFDVGDMVRHDHAVVADFLVDAHGSDHVHVAVVRKRLLKIEKSPFDIAKVDVEDLAPASKVADNVINLLAGMLEHLGHRPLAKVEPVVFAWRDLDKALE